MEAGSVTYTITAGRTAQPRTAPLSDALRSVVDLEPVIANLRREQETIDAQLVRQREWLNANRNDPLWEQRMAIHQARLAEREEIEQRCNHLLDSLTSMIEYLEGDEREQAWKRLLQWTEPPF